MSCFVALVGLPCLSADVWWAGTLGGAVGAVIGSLITVAHNRSEFRRAERLKVAERVHEALARHARNTLVVRSGVDDRDLDALVNLQPLRKRRGVRRRVQAYKQARDQGTRRDETGGLLVHNPGAVDQAIAALLPDTWHG